MKGQLWHIVLLAVSSSFAFWVWSRGEEAVFSKEEMVDMWSGSPESLSRIEFESKTAKVLMESKQDAAGRYYVVTSDKEESPSDADAGVPATPGKRVVKTFISARLGDDIVKKLSTLHAFRTIGKIDPSKVQEFNLDNPVGTLKVTVAGKEHAIVVGGPTVSGVERYVRDLGTNEVFAIPSELSQTVLFAENRLMEHDMHNWDISLISKLRVTKNGRSKELVRIENKRDGWADAQNPGKLDETAGNWMNKVGWIRTLEFVEKPSAELKPENLVMRIEFFEGPRQAGFLELFKEREGGEYLARSEYSRWYVKVPKAAAEQVERDLDSVLK